MSSKTLVLLSTRVDPNLFDTRFYKLKTVQKTSFLPDFIISNKAFCYIDGKNYNQLKMKNIVLITKRFANVIILVSNPAPSFQKWLTTLEYEPTVFLVPGNCSLLSSVLQSILPLIQELHSKNSNLKEKTKYYAEMKARNIFSVSKTDKYLSECISLSTGVDQNKILNTFQHVHSIQRMGLLTREILRNQYSLNNEESNSIANFFSEEEVEAPTYL